VCVTPAGNVEVQTCLRTDGKTWLEHGRIVFTQYYVTAFVPCTTDSDHEHRVAGNLLDRDFVADQPDRKWAGDIIYVWTDEGWLYVATIIDLCSRRIVGWAMASHMRAELCEEALKMALARLRPDAGPTRTTTATNLCVASGEELNA